MSHAATANLARRVLSDGDGSIDRTSGSATSSDISPSGPGRKRRHAYEYQPGSWWTHLLFGLATLAFLVVPSLLPGITVAGLIKVYMGFLVIVYGIVCVWGILRALRTTAAGKPTRP